MGNGQCCFNEPRDSYFLKGGLADIYGVRIAGVEFGYIESLRMRFLVLLTSLKK